MITKSVPVPGPTVTKPGPTVTVTESAPPPAAGAVIGTWRGTGNQTTLTKKYERATGILTVTLNLSAFTNDFASAAKDLCVPKTFCDWNGSKCVGKVGFGNLMPKERNIACSYAGKDVDCPTGGCVGFQVTLPKGFQADDRTAKPGFFSELKLKQCFPKDANWNVTPVKADSEVAGTCYQAPMKPPDFCEP